MKNTGSSLPNIEPGFTIGNLIVIEPTSQRKSRYIVWRCRCQCGNDVFLDTRTLQRGFARDCGCITKTKPGQINLAGRRFGCLTVLESLVQRDAKGNILWHCKCDCGNEVDVPRSQLTGGYKKSCGCLNHPPLKNYIGKKFGQLTVIAYAGKHGGIHRWRCQCSCGNETVVGQTLLQSGKTKSCGCLQARSIINNLKLCEGTSVTLLEASKRRTMKSNTSGYTGVYLNKKTGRWVAQITFKRKTYYLGSYKNIEDAVAARKRGEAMHDDFLNWYYSQNQTESSRGE